MHLYQGAIASLHRARKLVFVDELGWKLPVRDGGEFDEYDDDRAANIVGFSADGQVVMGMRFRSTDDRSMLVDHFSHALSPSVRAINGEHTWELSRGFCQERGVRRSNMMRKAACMIAPLEIALAAGVQRCVGFADVRMLAFCYGVGWKLNLLGEPARYEEGEAVAYEVEVSEAALDSMRLTWGLPRPAYVNIVSLDGAGSVFEAAERIAGDDPVLRRLLPPPMEAAAADDAGMASDERYYSRFEPGISS